MSVTQAPRVRVVPRGSRLSYGDLAGEFAAGYGLRPDPWQQFVLDDWMTMRHGQWAALTCGLAVPRQNGKNALLEIRELFGMVGRAERILHTAHQIKALDVATPVLAERGWITMGELVDGDRVWGPDGKLTNVITHPVRHGRPCYRLTFDDGQTVIADEDHLWGVTYVATWGKADYRVVSTKQIVKHGVSTTTPRDVGRDRKTYHFRVQLPEPLELPDAILPIDPWLFGAWLGDGTTAKGELTVGAEDFAWLTQKLDELGCDYVVRPDRRWPDRVFTVRIHGLAKQLRQLGVLGRKSIPREYLHGSVEQRRALLAGLMDTDGTSANGCSQMVIGMMCGPLMAQVLQLARSLGYKATLRTVQARFAGRDYGPLHKVQFQADSSRSPFSMPRKKAKLPEPQPRITRASYNTIVKVEPVAPRDTRCITVDNESRLYLVGHGFVATHNTARGAFKRLLYFFGTKVDDPNAKFPELNSRVAEIRSVNGQESITLKNGGSVEVIARSKNSGRGFTVDVLVMDEAQEMSDDDLEALMPTTSAAPQGNPQWLLTGTPPGAKANGEVFTRVRDEALGGKSLRLAWHEWSAAGDVDLDDRAVWYDVNPALMAGRLQMSVLEGERARFSDEGFSRERLGMWASAASQQVIADADWVRQADPVSVPTDRFALGIEVSPGGESASVALAGLRGDGAWHIELDEQRTGTAWVVPYVTALLAVNPEVRSIVADVGGPTALLADDFVKAKIRVTYPKVVEVAAACERLREGIVAGQVRHTGQHQLTLALQVARRRILAERGIWFWSRKNITADITPVQAASLALWGAVHSTVQRPARKPGGSTISVL